ncbi:MAG: hypothetical protein CMJ18_08650 [Phycisphaeraceae bacterium]|nr:hypothetical protein [Phycisphaeraceae bacterium]
MSDIAGIRPHGIAVPPNIGRAPATPQTSNGARAGDRVEFSDKARYLARLAELPDVREDLVQRVRQEIEAGRYDTPEKIEALLDELAVDLQ